MEIQHAIVQRDLRFYLPHKYLMYRHMDHDLQNEETEEQCPVHLTTQLDIMPRSQPFDWTIQDLPVLPFHCLLCMRLKHWRTVCSSLSARLRSQENASIIGMLDAYHALPWPDNRSRANDYMSEKACKALDMLANTFCRAVPSAEDRFIRLGFDISGVEDNLSAGAFPTMSTSLDIPESNTASLPQIAAAAAIQVLAQEGHPAAIFGSLACRLYGAPRLPNVSASCGLWS